MATGSYDTFCKLPMREQLEQQNKEAREKIEKRAALIAFLLAHPEFEEYQKLTQEAGY